MPDAKPDKELLGAAEELIQRKAKPFDPKAFKDQYDVALRELIDAKIEKRPPQEIEETRPSAKVINLMDALKRSVKGGGEARRKGKKAAAAESADADQEVRQRQGRQGCQAGQGPPRGLICSIRKRDQKAAATPAFSLGAAFLLVMAGSSPARTVPRALPKPDLRRIEIDAARTRRPVWPGGDGERAGQCPRRDDFAGGERRVVRGRPRGGPSSGVTPSAVRRAHWQRGHGRLTLPSSMRSISKVDRCFSQ